MRAPWLQRGKAWSLGARKHIKNANGGGVRVNELWLIFVPFLSIFQFFCNVSYIIFFMTKMMYFFKSWWIIPQLSRISSQRWLCLRKTFSSLGPMRGADTATGVWVGGHLLCPVTLENCPQGTDPRDLKILYPERWPSFLGNESILDHPSLWSIQLLQLLCIPTGSPHNSWAASSEGQGRRKPATTSPCLIKRKSQQQKRKLGDDIQGDWWLGDWWFLLSA